MTPDERIAAFQADYIDLCRRHGITLVYDGGYRPYEVRPLDRDEEFNGPLVGGEDGEWVLSPLDFPEEPS